MSAAPIVTLVFGAFLLGYACAELRQWLRDDKRENKRAIAQIIWAANVAEWRTRKMLRRLRAKSPRRGGGDGAA